MRQGTSGFEHGRTDTRSELLVVWRGVIVDSDGIHRHQAEIGTFVPNTVKIEPMPSKVTANNPSLQPYDFAMVNHKLVIVDPSNKVIADVLSK